MEIGSTNGTRRDASNTHKAMRQRLERLESSLNAIPPAMEEAVEGLEAHCTAGIKLASLLETVLQDSPLLLLALRYKEACETLLDKTSRAALALKGELVVPVKRLGPTVSRLRSHIDSHAKAASRHESCLRQLEGVMLSSSASRSKKDQVEGKFCSSAQEFALEDQQLGLANTEFTQMRTELMGGCFLGYLEVVFRVLESASDLLAPLGSYKELRNDLRDSPGSSVLKEATVSWLAATQVNQSLRSFGGLTRNDVQCMLYQHPDGLPGTIRSGLNTKVDQLLKVYSTELARVETPHHVLTGGFHFNPKAIELALKDCCSELEAKGAGADHAYTMEAKMEQVMCDVPRTTYNIGGREFGAATGEHAAANVREKKAAVKDLLESLLVDSDLTIPQLDSNRDQILKDYSHHVLNESCTTVTNTTAKTAVQLVFGKANLVLVRPSPASEDSKPVQISARKHDSTILITVFSSWWLVEDYAAFAVLQRPVDPSASLGVVDACYNIPLSIQNYCSDSPFPELPSVSVIYRPPPCPSSSPIASSSPPQPIVGSKEKEKLLGSFTILRNKFRNISQKTRSRMESPRSGPTLRTYIEPETSGGEGKEVGEEESERKTSTDSEAPAPFGVSRYSSGRSDSFGRGLRPGYRQGMRRSGSDDTMSSQSTLVPHSSLLHSEDHPLGIADLIHTSRPTLTQSRVRAHDKYRLHSYQPFRAEVGKGGKEREEEKEDDQRTIEGSPTSHDISIVSDSELERVYSLLSSENNSLTYPDYQKARKTSHPAGKKPGFQDRHGNDYSDGEGRYHQYGYVAGGGYLGPGYGGGRDPEQKDRDVGSSSSSGIEDPYNHRSRSGSAASMHPETEGGRERGNGGGGGHSSSTSLDSGVGGARKGGEEVVRLHRGAQDLPIAHLSSKGLGSLIHSDQGEDYPTIFDMERPPVSSSSSEGSSPVMFRTRSVDNIRLPERPTSRTSTHSMPPGSLHGSTSSLNDFDHTPGSRPRPFDYRGPLSQGSLEDRYWDYREHPRPPEHFGHPPYNYSGPPGRPHGGPFNYEGGYGEPPPHERHSRSMQGGVRGHSEDFSPSPGPPMDHRPHPPYWQHGSFDGPPPPSQSGHPLPPPHMPMPRPHGPPGARLRPPPGPHPMHDNRFQPVQFRPIAPQSPSPASLHSMSPAPSPHPTPPPTPPPPRPHPQVHGPPPSMPPPYHSPGPHPHMHPLPREFHPPPPPPMGPPHGYRGPVPPREPTFGPPPPFGPSPSPGPPVSGPGRFPLHGGPPPWDWRQH